MQRGNNGTATVRQADTRMCSEAFCAADVTIGRVSAMTRTPVLATLLAGGLVLVTAVAVPFEHLLVWTNALTLSLFIAVDLALWHLPRPGGAATIGFRVPRFVPVVAAALSLSLLAAEMLS
jgi:basic amino acid/polyamine antiporter, APA family